MERTNILLPIETIVRELDYRLVLAALLANKHRRIFIGRSPTTYRLARQMKGGVYVGKHIFHGKPGEPVYRQAKQRGFVVLHHSEEGAVFTGREDAWEFELRRQLDVNEVAAEDFVCTWGDYQRDFYKRGNPPCAENILTVGHPRFDLVKPKYGALYEDDVQRIRAKYGDFVLINSNFAIVSNPVGTHRSFSRPEGYDPDDDVVRERFVSFWARVSRTLASYMALVHKLSIRRKDINFVFRPHPSDDMVFYQGVFNSIPNIHVVREGAVAPWIRASRVVIHDGCTTGLEAHLFDRPVVNYRPERDPDTENFLPNLFGVTCTTEQEAIDAVLGLLERRDAGAIPVDLPPRAHALLYNLRAETFPEMLAVIERAEERSRNGSYRAPPLARIRSDEVREALVERAKDVVRPLSHVRYATALEGRALFPGFARDLIAKKIEAVRRITGNPIDVTRHSRNLLEINSSRA
jgi:surface carbohydrate biosynthesis protein